MSLEPDTPQPPATGRVSLEYLYHFSCSCGGRWTVPDLDWVAGAHQCCNTCGFIHYLPDNPAPDTEAPKFPTPKESPLTPAVLYKLTKT